MAKGPKLYILHRLDTGVSDKYEVSEPYRWEDMTRAERVRWAQAALRRKNSEWVYVQILGLPY